MNLKNISVIITTFNEEENIARCLDRCRGYGEIIVVDSFSSDKTLDVARQYPVTIYRRPYPSAAKQKNWALDRVTKPWVLILDSDEMITDELEKALVELEPKEAADGYWIYRDSEYLGRPIRHCGWQRDKVLRFFRRDAGRYGEVEVHEEVVLKGKASVLGGKLLHFPYSRVEQHFKKIEEYSTRGALDYVGRDGRFALLNMIFHPPFRFLRMYVLQKGFLDGNRGFILCLMAAYSVFLKYAKAWESRDCQKQQ